MDSVERRQGEWEIGPGGVCEKEQRQKKSMHVHYCGRKQRKMTTQLKLGQGGGKEGTRCRFYL